MPNLIRAALFTLCICPVLAKAEPTAVDLMLVLATDVSTSVNDEEYALQKNGVVAALKDPQLVEVLDECAPNGVAMTYFEWSTRVYEGVPFTRVTDAESLGQFADAIAANKKGPGDGTNVALALRRAARLITQAPFRAPRRVIDISSDGSQNDYYAEGNVTFNSRQGKAAVGYVRDQLARLGLVINALVIDSPNSPVKEDPDGEPDLETYYNKHVITGVNSFARVIHNFNEYASAFKEKLKREICAANAGLAPASTTKVAHR